MHLNVFFSWIRGSVLACQYGSSLENTQNINILATENVKKRVQENFKRMFIFYNRLTLARNKIFQC